MGFNQRTIKEMVQILCLRHEQNEKWGTSALYHSVYNAIHDYCQSDDANFEIITSSWLKSFEGYLRAKGHS